MYWLLWYFNIMYIFSNGKILQHFYSTCRGCSKKRNVGTPTFFGQYLLLMVWGSMCYTFRGLASIQPSVLIILNTRNPTAIWQNTSSRWKSLMTALPISDIKNPTSINSHFWVTLYLLLGRKSVFSHYFMSCRVKRPRKPKLPDINNSHRQGQLVMSLLCNYCRQLFERIVCQMLRTKNRPHFINIWETATKVP